MDRVKYLQNLRREMLERLGLPQDAPPEKVLELLQKNGGANARDQAADLSMDGDRREYLKLVRGRVLKNMGLPEDLPPEAVSFLLRKKNR
jgi:hypothetical protein